MTAEAIPAVATKPRRRRWPWRQRPEAEEQKYRSIIEVRHEELETLIESIRQGPNRGSAQLSAANRAKALIDAYNSAAELNFDRVAEHLHKLDGFAPLLAPDARLVLQLEQESSRDPDPDPRHIGLDKPGRSRATTIVTSFTSPGGLSQTERAQAEEIILSLWQKRDDKERHTIAVRRIRARYMRWLSASLVGGVVLLSLLLSLVSIRPTQLWLGLAAAAVAGALGGTLGGTFRVRDSLEKIAELKESWPAVVAQPFVGATAGLIVFALFATNMVKVADLEVTLEGGGYAWAPLAVVAFVAGFSERFFLRNVDLVQRGRSSPESPSASCPSSIGRHPSGGGSDAA